MLSALTRFWRTPEKVAVSEAVTRSKYDPQNKAHAEYIKLRVQAFHQALQKVQKIDQIVIAGGSADLLLWLIGTFGAGVSLLLAMGLAYYSLQYEDRRKHAKELSQTLADLLATYQWCAKDHGVAISKDPQFLLLLTQLAPYIHSKELLLWDLTANDGAQLSPDFMEILSASPHRLQFVGVYSKSHPNVDPTVMDAVNALLKNENGLVQNQMTRWLSKQLEGNKYCRIFNQGIAESRLALYGKEPDEPALRVRNLR